MSKNKEILNFILGNLTLKSSFEKKLAKTIYSELAKGKPVKQEILSSILDTPISEVVAILSLWNGIYRNSDNEIIGFWGLAIDYDSPHQIVVNEKVLNCWCFWDTLFIADLLKGKVTVTSESPETKESIKISVNDGEVVSSSHPNAVCSFILPEENNKDVISSFCHYVYFFSDRNEFKSWKEKSSMSESLFCLDFSEAFELGSKFNRVRFE